MILTGFLPKVRLCLCLLPGVLFGSCSLFHDTAQTASEQQSQSMATIMLYSPGNEEESMMNVMGQVVVNDINYLKVNCAPFHQQQIIEVQFRVHNRQELDHVVDQLISEGIIIKRISYNQ
jgi:hypothetical protein